MRQAIVVALTCIAIFYSVSLPAEEGPCVILKRMGPADEVTSRLYSFGIRGKQFQYVEGVFPKGMKFHGRLTDHDVREIFDKGGRIAIVEPRYSVDDLKVARETCKSAQVPREAVTSDPNNSHLKDSSQGSPH